MSVASFLLDIYVMCFYSSQTAASTVLLLRIKITHVDVLIIIKLTVVPPVQTTILQRDDFVYDNGIFKIAAGRIRMFALFLIKQIDQRIAVCTVVLGFRLRESHAV